MLQVLEWGQNFARELESMVKKYPEQWFNFFPFWSTPPTPPEGVKASSVRNYSKEELSKPRAATLGLAAAPIPSGGKAFQL